MSVSSRFDMFLNNLRPTTQQLDDARTKYDGVCKKLHDYYYTSVFDGSTRLLIGSFGKKTNIRPPRDVDALFMMLPSEFQRYNSYAGNGQSQLLQKIKDILADRYATTDGIRGDGQVVVIPFDSGHRVELLPAWRRTDGKYTIPNTHSGGSWRVADPITEMKQIGDSDNAHSGNTRNLIRMLKAWQRFCSVPIKSLALELRVVNFLKSYQYADKSSVYYDWMVRDFFGELLRYVNGNCEMPGLEEKIQYGNEWKSKAESAHARAVKACEYEAANREVDATTEWRKIFGEDFNY